MVSLFTLGVSFAAGVFFALGGYWNMLTGAVLGWLSSVLDGCDGEVARLKLQESAFAAGWRRYAKPLLLIHLREA